MLDDLQGYQTEKDRNGEVLVILFVVFVGFVNFVMGFVVAMSLGYGPRHGDEVRRFLLGKR